MALEFTINLNGNFKGALEKNAKGLDEQSKATKHAKDELELFEGELGKVQAGALQLNFNSLSEGGSFFKFDLAEGAKIAYEVIEKVVEKVVELGSEMVRAAGKAEDLNLAIKLDVGDEGEKQVDELADSFKGTRFDDDAIKEALLPILEESGNKNAGLWDDLATAATDVATRRNSGVAGAKQALIALNDIELNPERLRGSLKELGIKQAGFYKDLGGLLGISEKEAEEQTKAGKVKSQTLLSVALNQIAQREGGALGNATNEGSKTLGASIERLGNLKDNLFKQLAGSEGMKKLQGIIDNVVDVLGGPTGTAIMQKFSAGFSAAVDVVRATWPYVVAGFNFAKDIVVDLVDAFGPLVGGIIDAGKGLGQVALWLADSLHLGDLFKDVWTGTMVIVKEIGREVQMIVDGWRDIIGFYKDVKSGQIGKDLKDFFHGERGAVASDAVNDNSPAWKKARAAAAAPGAPGQLSVPMFAAGGMVTGPTLALIGEKGPEAVVPLGRSFGSLPEASNDNGPAVGAPTITYAPHFTFSGSTSREVRDQVEGFEQQHRAALKQFLDEVRAAVGA
jgi:hypothetical protein